MYSIKKPLSLIKDLNFIIEELFSLIKKFPESNNLKCLAFTLYKLSLFFDKPSFLLKSKSNRLKFALTYQKDIIEDFKLEGYSERIIINFIEKYVKFGKDCRNKLNYIKSLLKNPEDFQKFLLAVK